MKRIHERQALSIWATRVVTAITKRFQRAKTETAGGIFQTDRKQVPAIINWIREGYAREGVFPSNLIQHSNYLPPISAFRLENCFCRFCDAKIKNYGEGRYEIILKNTSIGADLEISQSSLGTMFKVEFKNRMFNGIVFDDM